MKIIEIKQAKIDEKEFFFPFNHWLNIKNGVIDRKVNIGIENFDIQIDVYEKYKQINHFNDLKDILNNLNISIIDLDIFRLKLIDTTKWGEKIIYEEGAKSICFSCLYKKIEDSIYLIFFNTDGTKSIENIYMHGVWKIEENI